MGANQKHLIQETFEVSEVSDRSRKRIVRQDRVLVDPGSCFLEFSGKKIEVVNYTPFGIACIVQLNSYKPGDEISNALFLYDNIEIGEIHCRCVRVERDNEGHSVAAFEITGDPIKVDVIAAVKAARLILKEIESENDCPVIPSAFKLIVYEMKVWFERLQFRANQLVAPNSIPGSQAAREFENAAIDIVADQLKIEISSWSKSMEEALKGADSTTLRLCIEFLRQTLKDLIYQAPFGNRAFFKPRGYAGDFEMMNFIYRDEAEGASIFARCLQRWQISLPASRAVRNRAQYLKSKIIETVLKASPGQTIKILSVACGPAMEIQDLLMEDKIPKNIKLDITLLDQDEEALKHAQFKIRSIQRPNGNLKISFSNCAIKNVIGRGVGDNEFDLIYSAGLFDYLSDPVAKMAGMRLFESVKPGGMLVIGNFNNTNEDAFIMEKGFDWNLIYRTPADLNRLFGNFTGNMKIESEELALNLFCNITKL